MQFMHFNDDDFIFKYFTYSFFVLRMWYTYYTRETSILNKNTYEYLSNSESLLYLGPR